MSDSLIQFPAMVNGASFAGTCLMHTMMFTRGFLFRAISARTQTPDHAEVEILRSAQDDIRWTVCVICRTNAGKLGLHWCRQNQTNSKGRILPMPCARGSARNPDHIRDRDVPG